MMYEKIRLTIGVVATLGLYSMLYRENKFYRFFAMIGDRLELIFFFPLQIPFYSLLF